MEKDALLEAYHNAPYHLAGHGPRNVQVLKDAFFAVDGQQEGDRYGSGDFIEPFEAKMARFLGKEAAVFFPSGTMAQQIALRIWCERLNLPKVAYHPLCHLEIHEQDGLKVLHRIEPVLLADTDRLIALDDVLNMSEQVACLLLELPQREIGGELPDYATLEAISAWCQEHGIRRHLDGARLFECLPYYQKTADEISQLFDSVYVSFYKGIGGIAGAILAGDRDFIEEAKVWKRRHGGDLISLYPYIVTADYYFDRRIGSMAKYYAEAQELAGFFNESYHTSTRPLVPVTNMFHVHFDIPKSQAEAVLAAVYQETGVGFTGTLRKTGDSTCSFELSIGDLYESVPKEPLRQAFRMLDAEMRRIG